ncbi:hypothetical protein BP6252_12103 [Coleophoma cylindrospora]|uniref:YWTD domain-containing protein n=1 Tax=Coleophoma cylindrospora TaxID=1849047 RepID=A0A3D8QGB8_9HELO|nr:hypothetical protein BP6252_12103 [Coleophoma cylindrospora]
MSSTAVSSEGRLYIIELDLSSFPNQNGRIVTCRPDGSELKDLITGLKHLPDGIAIDEENGHIYWTNMGASTGGFLDGSIQRSNLDGSNITTIVPQGTIHTPKQLTLAQSKERGAELYWCDREGMRVMRCGLDGSNVETLVKTGESLEDRQDQKRWCVGIAVDTAAGVMYWTQKGGSKGNVGRIFRAPLVNTKNEAPDGRTDIEVLFDKLPEPIDLHINTETKVLYWTDRGDPPFGNSVNCARVADSKDALLKLMERRVLTRKLHEGIGLAVDEVNGKMYFTDLLGGVYSANVDGSDKQVLHADIGDCTGIAYSLV